MKKWWIVSLLLAAMCLPTIGCITTGSGQNWRDNVPQLKADIFMFSKMATRIALTEAKMPTEDVVIINGYLVAIRDLLEQPGQPKCQYFAGARVLVQEKLPPKYRVYGFTLLDLLERYLQTTNLNITEDQELILALISSGIDGSLEAVQEFAG